MSEELSRIESSFPDVSELEKIQASEIAVNSVLLDNAAEMIATIGNQETKALTFAAMNFHGNNQALSNGDVYRLFLGIQGEDGAWSDMGHAVPGQYARETFEPIGAIAKSKEQTTRGIRDHYTVTGYGQRVGIAVTGMMLDLSLQYPDLSLYKIFAKTGTASDRKQRSPGTRLKIFEALATRGSEYISSTTLSELVNIEAAALTQPITDLTNAGIIETIRFQRSASDKRISCRDVEAFRNTILHTSKGEGPTLIRDFILRSIENGEDELSVEDIIDYATTQNIDPGLRDMREYVGDTIRLWSDKGLLSIDSQFTNQVRSKIRIRPEYSELITEVLTHLEGIMQGDQAYLDWGEQRAKEIVSSPLLVNKLLEKAKKASPNKNSESVADYQNRILGILTDQPMSAQQIHGVITDQGKPTSVASVRRILLKLEELGSIKFIVKSGTKMYMKNDQANTAIV